jgi:hypothetical protein
MALSSNEAFMRPILIITCLVILSTGCTTVPVGHGRRPDVAALGPPVLLRVCILRDVEVVEEDARGILAALQEGVTPYGLSLEFPWVRDWQRPAFSHTGILKDVARRPLEAPCDRLLALVGRDVRDFLWGALMPEVLGAVETRTHSKGFVVAETGSLNQLLSFTPPHQAAVHELFHLLGVDHDDDPEGSLRQIMRIKQAAMDNRRAGRDFFPAMTPRGTVYTTRRAVDLRFRIMPSEICVAAADGSGCPAPG